MILELQRRHSSTHGEPKTYASTENRTLDLVISFEANCFNCFVRVTRITTVPWRPTLLLGTSEINILVRISREPPLSNPENRTSSTDEHGRMESGSVSKVVRNTSLRTRTILLHSRSYIKQKSSKPSDLI